MIRRFIPRKGSVGDAAGMHTLHCSICNTAAAIDPRVTVVLSSPDLHHCGSGGAWNIPRYAPRASSERGRSPTSTTTG